MKACLVVLFLIAYAELTVQSAVIEVVNGYIYLGQGIQLGRDKKENSCVEQHLGRKTYAPIDKNANLAFINMEGGGSRPQPNAPPAQPPANSQPQPKTPTTPPSKPTSSAPTPTKPPAPVVTPITIKPTPAKPAPPPGPMKPSQPIKPSPVSTPGPGSVKSLVNFYDSKGKGSPIRPYSYSQAVKQG